MDENLPTFPLDTHLKSTQWPEHPPADFQLRVLVALSDFPVSFVHLEIPSPIRSANCASFNRHLQNASLHFANPHLLAACLLCIATHVRACWKRRTSRVPSGQNSPLRTSSFESLSPCPTFPSPSFTSKSQVRFDQQTAQASTAISKMHPCILRTHTS